MSRSAFGAEQLPVDLTWTAPEDCADRGEVEQTVTEMLGAHPVPGQGGPIRAAVELRASPDGGFDVKLVTEAGDRRGERALHASDCVDARRAVALLLAIMLDPNAGRSGEQPTPQAPVAQPATPDRAPPPPAPARPARPRSGLLAGLGGTADFGTLPHFGYGAELRLGFFRDRWSMELRGAAWLPRSSGHSALPGAGGNFTLVEGALATCVILAEGGPWALDGCAGSALMRMQGTGFGMSDAGQASAVFAAGLAETGLAVRASPRLSARFSLGARLPFSRPTFAIEGIGPVHRPRELVGRAELGLLMLF